MSGDIYGEQYTSQQAVQQHAAQQQQLQQQQQQLQYDMAQIKLGTPPVSPLLLTTMPTFSQIQQSHVVPASPATQPHQYDQEQQRQPPRTFEHRSVNGLNSGGETQSSSQTSNNCGSPVYNAAHSSTPLSTPPSQTFTYPTVTDASCSPLIAGLESDFDLFPLQYPQQHPLQSQTPPQPPQQHPSSLSFAPEFPSQGHHHQNPHHQYHQHSLSEGTIHMAVSTSAPLSQEAPQVKQEESDDTEFGYYYPPLLPSPSPSTGNTPSTSAIKVERQGSGDDRSSRRPKSMIATSS
ncbi:hypothetical protein BGZ74_005932, partial [Mortierella antarctica]